MKVVSLLPAATEIVSALGICDALVGRSHACDYPEEVAELPALTRPRVDTSLPGAALDAEVKRVRAEGLPLYMLDAARLAALAPDVVVTQAACEVCAISQEQVVDALKRTAYAAHVVTLLPSRLGDVIEDVRRVADACGVGARGDALARRLRERLEAAAARTTERPRVAVVEWLEPPMLAGHWVPEAVEAAGGVALGPGPGEPSRYWTWQEIEALRPDAVLVAPCGFDLARTLEESAPLAARLAALAPRVLFLDGNAYLNRPGPRLVDAVERIAAWLRSERVDGELARELEAAADEPVEPAPPAEPR